jgi:hypothetical protein
MPLILDNKFTQDTYAMRGVRLSDLSGNINPFALELGLSQTQIDWATGAFQAFVDAQAKTQLEEGEKSMAQEKYENDYDKSYQKYMRIKELLNALIKDTPQESELERAYGIKGTSPQTYNSLCTKIETLSDENDILVAAGDTRVAPASAVDELKEFKADLVKAAQRVGVERKESAQAYDALHALFQEDTQQMRIIYQIATLVWGTRSPNLLSIGFAPAKPHPGGGQPDAPASFKYNVADNVLSFSWVAAENATSYQLVYSADNEVWEELYAGDLLTFDYEQPIGKRWYKVRARNTHGFGNFSDTVSYEREL